VDKVKPLRDMSIDELIEYRSDIIQQIEENKKRYETRYNIFPADYAASINDEYNGDADDYSRLYSILSDINKEITEKNK
jgi:hypothetical protein